jgi:hypothetical protein
MGRLAQGNRVFWRAPNATAVKVPPHRTGTVRPQVGAVAEFGAAEQPEDNGVMSNRTREHSQELGDFTTTARVVPISVAAIGIGILGTIVAWALLRLIAFFTNVFYYGRASTVFVSPAANHLGWFAVAVPVAGGLIIGLMARYGSERIRGHGIPEALESILIGGSKVAPRLAVLKPICAAISIRIGRAFRRRRPDHHDGRRAGKRDLTALSTDGGGTKDVAGRRHSRWDVRHIRGPHRGHAAGG